MHFKGINQYGDLGLMLDFGSKSSKSISQEVNSICSMIIDLDLQALNTTPSFNKIVISFSSEKKRDNAQIQIEQKLTIFNARESKKIIKQWKIPVCYEDDYALDLELIQKIHQLSKEEVIARHSQITYYTYYIGFMPGFPYLGDIDPSLVTPRLKAPRIQIPARSVGIAKEHTCIYPKVSPGGWNIIGQVPFDIFCLDHPQTSLFLPGDEIEFTPISKGEFEKIQNKNFLFDELIKEFSE
tara:strand:+ start:455 stop:1174 length:720 start_codon:yes stop_codon:yes gene_type:complete